VYEQHELTQIIAQQLALSVNVSLSRITSENVAPINATAFHFNFAVIPPTNVSELTATETSSRIQSLSDPLGPITLRVSFGSHFLTASGSQGQIILDETTTTAPTPVPTLAPTSTSAPTPIPAVDLNAGNAAGATENGSGWHTRDTINLLIAILITVVVMLIAFQVVYIRRKRQNIMVEIAGGNVSPIRDPWWTPNVEETSFKGQHYYPEWGQ
jgi:hypothetical protein